MPKVDPIESLVVSQEEAIELEKRGMLLPVPFPRPQRKVRGERFIYLPREEYSALLDLCCEDTLSRVEVQIRAQLLGDALNVAYFQLGKARRQ